MALGTNLGILASVTSTPVFSNTYSLDFDGVDDYVYAPQSFLNSASVFSVSFWAKKLLASDDVLIGHKISTFQGAWVNWYTDGNVYFTCRTGGNITLVAALSFDTNWHHFLCTKNGTDAKIYIDGVLSAITPTNGTVAITLPATCGDNFRIGSLDASTFGNSTIDEVALWDSVIAIGDVWDGRGQPTDLTDLSPIAWYRMGDNGSYKSPQWLLPNNENKDKVSNYSLDFDGVDDYVDCGDSDDFSFGNGTTDSPFSISAWIKMDDASAFRVATKYVNANREYLFTTDTSDRLSFALYDNSNGSRIQRKYNTALTSFQGQWINVIGTYDGSSLSSGIKIYLNGTRVDDIDGNLGTYIAMENTTQPLEIGRSNLTSFSNGKIDEAAIFNTELSSADALAIYNGGEPTTLPSGAVAHYKMGEEANFTSNWLVDNSALSNYSKRSFDFDGVDDYVNAGASTLSGETALSISAWVYPTAYGDATAPSFVSTDAASPRAFYLGLYNGTNFRFSLSTNGANLTSLDTGIGTVDLNTWQHILVTWDQVNLKLYKNGVLLKTVATTFASNGTFTTTNDLLIGARRPTDGLFEGKIDEVAIFNSVVDIADVWDGSGEPIDVSAVSGIVSNYRMGEDASFNGTNWTVPDNVGSNNGTSNAMTVDALVGEAPNYSGGGISNAMTIEDRVGEAPSSSNNAISFNMESVDRTTDVPI